MPWYFCVSVSAQSQDFCVSVSAESQDLELIEGRIPAIALQALDETLELHTRTRIRCGWYIFGCIFSFAESDTQPDYESYFETISHLSHEERGDDGEISP